MSFKTILLTLFLFFGFTFSNCNSDEFGCGDLSSSRPYFDIQDMLNVRHYIQQDNVFSPLPDSSAISFANYLGIAMEFDADFIAHHFDKKSWDFSLLPSALACSPIEDGSAGSKEESFKNIQVQTLFDFDEDHLSNSNINDLLSIRGYEYGYFLSDTMLLNDFLAVDDLIESQQYLIKLQQAPVLSDKFQIRIVVELSTGEVYEQVSSLVEFM